MKPIINPISEKLVTKIAADLPHALLLSGEDGVGLRDIAEYIAYLRKSKPEIILPEKDEKIDLEKGIIGVETMRQLYDEMRTKSVAERIIIIDYAERMSVQAQNAFLKLLEEPGANIHFILVTNSSSKLLSTILSRTENIHINEITIEQSNQLLDEIGVTDKTKRAQLLFIASGLPAELIKLNNDDKYFQERSEIVRDARELLQGKTYQKLLTIQKYKDNRSNVLILLSDMANMLKNTALNNPQINTLKLSDTIINVYQNIEANGNIRLCLAQMVL